MFHHSLQIVQETQCLLLASYLSIVRQFAWYICETIKPIKTTKHIKCDRLIALKIFVSNQIKRYTYIHHTWWYLPHGWPPSETPQIIVKSNSLRVLPRLLKRNHKNHNPCELHMNTWAVCVLHCCGYTLTYMWALSDVTYSSQMEILHKISQRSPSALHNVISLFWHCFTALHYVP